MDREDELETFLQRRSFLQRRFAESDRLEPPPEIDRIVLSRAREAIHVSEPPGIFRSARWALPFSLAAVLVLSFAIVLSVRLTPPPSGSSTYVAQAKLETSSPAPAAADNSFAATPGAPAPATAPETMSLRSALEPTSAQATSQGRRGSASENDSPLPLADRTTGAAEAMPEPTAPASAPSAPPSTGIVAMNRARHQDVVRIASTDAAERSAPQRDEGRSSNAASHAYSQLPPRASEAPAPDSVSKARAPAARALAEVRNPEIWLKQIEQLRDNRMFAEAQREWNAFRKAYPNHPRVRRIREPASSAAPSASVADLAPPAEQPPSQPAR